MNAAQTKAVEHFRSWLTRHAMTDNSVEKYGQQITKFEVTEYDRQGTQIAGLDGTRGEAVWIRADIELTRLPDNNLLRALEHQHWFVHVGSRGRLDVHMAPKSWHQFRSRKYAIGLCFKKVG